MATGVAGPPMGGVSSEGLKISMTELNPHFVCVLCFGYFVDATTITECMHTFCKSCIVNFLRTNHHCPHCDTLLSRTRPFNSLRHDRVMQSLVYKTVPGLFQIEMRRRIQFYQNHPHQDFEPDVEGIQDYIFNPEDSVSLSIRYYNFSGPDESCSTKEDEGIEPCHEKEETLDEDPATAEITTVRYFRCPATVPVSVLKALVKTKYRIPESLRVELLYGEERLLDSWTLMEVAYIFQWKRESPMELSFQVLITKKVKRKRLRLVRKKKEPNKSERNPLGNSSRAKNNDNGPQEPPLKIPRIEEPSSFSSTTDEHHPRPPTPPETPDGPADMNVDSDNPPNFLPKSPTVKREESFTGACETSSKSKDHEIGYTTLEAGDSLFTENKNSEDSETYKNEADTAEDQRYYSEEPESSSKNMEEERYERSNSLTEEEDNVRMDDDSADFAGDQDSEAPLEVDTSHETEPEAENEGEMDMDRDDSNKYERSRKNEEIDEEEQGDSAIDVNETSTSEVIDSDDKDTDFNVSTESIDVEGNVNNREQKTDDKSCNDDKQEEAPLNLVRQSNSIEENAADNEEKKKQKDGTSGTDDLGVLDLSCHARSVRAQRENLDSPVTPSPSPPSSESERDSKGHSIQNFLNSSQCNSAKRSVKGTLKQGQQNGQSREMSPGPNNLLASPAVISPRPPLPLDWVRPPLVGATVAPHAAAFRDLVTLSHAAVQLQLAMAHAQAQAQAQAEAQAQAQKFKAQVQANVLKNLKASESLSFVNGSGDTLTISPIPGNQGNPKPKTSSKLSKNKINSVNQNGTLNKNAVGSSAGHNKLGKTSNSPLLNKSNKEFPVHSSGNSINKTNNNTSINSNNTCNSNNGNLKSAHGNLKTATPKSSSTSLKIPNIHVNSKNSSNKMEKDKKEHDKDKERTGDPVFKITNQKLIEFVRQQHLNNKLKQSSNNNGKTNSNSNESLTMKISTNSSSMTSGQNSKPTIKPTLAVVPTSSNLNNKSNNPMTKGSNVPGSHKPSTNTSASSNPISSSLTKVPAQTITSTSGTKPNSISSEKTDRLLQNGKSPSSSLTPKSLSISSSASSTNTLRTTNTHVRQIPNPSRLHQQSENRLSVGMGRVGGVAKKGISSGSQPEGLSRIESLTRSLHEKVAASAGVTTGVLNSLAR